jgi:hypothetical protein
MAMKMSCPLAVILLFPLLVNPYTWKFNSSPRQRENVTLSIEGSGGQPPYSLLILPAGVTPLRSSAPFFSLEPYLLPMFPIPADQD